MLDLERILETPTITDIDSIWTPIPYCAGITTVTLWTSVVLICGEDSHLNSLSCDKPTRKSLQEIVISIDASFSFFLFLIAFRLYTVEVHSSAETSLERSS